MKYTVISILFSVLIGACKNEPDQTVQEAPKERIAVKTKGLNPDPPFTTYTNFDDLEYIFQKETDTTYVINFWATWCGPCVKELPYFEKLNQKYKNGKFKMILVSLDFKRAKLVSWLEKRPLEPEVIFLDVPNGNSFIDRVSKDWSGAIPATVIYNKNKRGFYEQSVEDFEELEEMVKEFL